jgi:hypothetical protein
MHPTRRKLLDLVVGLEYARHRNDAQHRQLRTAAGKMADHATKSLAELAKRAEAGDREALVLYRRAAAGRVTARRVARLGDDDGE